ncbi:MAG TPA: geranylgeranyl reductase family protein [Marmoricola sp.]|nr:geranylgeranyl reductase family protein [Marmoricola sp.]
MGSPWDLVVAGAGPAGTATALGALAADPALRVLLLDRTDFPRDKPCGDGVAPHVVELLETVGVTGLVDDQVPVRRLRLTRRDLTVEREMARPAWVVPRTVLDHRLLQAAQRAGAHLVRHRVRSVATTDGRVRVDDRHEGRVLVGADGAHSEVRGSLDLRPGRRALAIRGYAPTPPARAGAQVIVFGTSRQPSYAWSFDRGDGLSNVGYGELLTDHRARPTRTQLMDQLDTLLPGAADGGTRWRGHPLPVSASRWRPGRGRVLLAGDAAGLVNPMTGEGIYYAVATGLAAGRAAADSLRLDGGASAGARYRRAVRPQLSRHLRHTATAARLCLHGGVLDAGIRASSHDQRVFDDLVELGLARGRITTTMARGLLGAMTVHSSRGDTTCEC